MQCVKLIMVIMIINPVKNRSILRKGSAFYEVGILRFVAQYNTGQQCEKLFTLPIEVAGFSGGAKYLLPGIAGPDMINFTHWLGALSTSKQTIGVKDTDVQ